MLAADILEVLVSRRQNRYLLVVMDYFTKWAEAAPLKDQTAASIPQVVIKICCSFGIPDILHSDQGCRVPFGFKQMSGFAAFGCLIHDNKRQQFMQIHFK